MLSPKILGDGIEGDRLVVCDNTSDTRHLSTRPAARQRQLHVVHDTRCSDGRDAPGAGDLHIGFGEGCHAAAKNRTEHTEINLRAPVVPRSSGRRPLALGFPETAPTSPGQIEGALASAEHAAEATTTAGPALRLAARPPQRDR